MRRGDRKILEDYNEVAKDALADDLEGAELERLEQVLDWKLEKAAEKQQTPKETQEAVYRLQEEKQKIMQELKEQLRCLDNPECTPETEKDARLVVEHGDSYFATQEDGSEQEVSQGDILTDGEWGIQYHLDDTLSRSTRKRYLVSEARRRVEDMLDLQLLVSGAGSVRNVGSHDRAYREVLRGTQSGEQREMRSFIAERMARTLPTRFVVDGALPFRVHRADAHEDIEQKMDFLLEKKNHRRGVEVEEDELLESVAIQFTIARGERSAEFKRRQLSDMREKIGSEITEVDDYILLQIPGKWASGAYKKWEDAGRPSGGPERFLSDVRKEQLFKKPLEKMFTEEEIDEMWERVNNNDASETELPKAA